MKVLFATDGSPHALSALKSLADRLNWFRDAVELTVMTVHPPLPYRRAASWAGHETLAKYYDEEGEAAVAASVKELERRGIPHKVDKRVGEPAATICDAAKGEHYDLIAMGTQGHTALASLMLGSVSSKVLAIAPVPVMLLR